MVIIQGNIPLNNVSVIHDWDHYNSLFTGLFASNFSLFKSFSHIAVDQRFDRAIPSLRILWSHLIAYRVKTKQPKMSLNADTIWPQLNFNYFQSYPVALLACALFRSSWHFLKNPSALPNRRLPGKTVTALEGSFLSLSSLAFFCYHKRMTSFYSRTDRPLKRFWTWFQQNTWTFKFVLAS